MCIYMYMYIYVCVCMCIYRCVCICVCLSLSLHVVELLSGPSLASLRVILWAKFVVYFLYVLVEKRYKMGFQHVLEKSCTQKSENCYLGQVGHFCCTKLGPDNNPYLAQTITLKMVCFVPFLLSKCVEIPKFTVFFEYQHNVCPKLSKRTTTFHIFETKVYKITMLEPEDLPKSGVYNLSFLKDTNFVVELKA